MRMNASAFFALNAKITRLQAEEEAIALAVTHSSKPQERLNELIARIKGAKDPSQSSKAIVLQAVVGEAGYEETAGEIAALRERQRQSAEKLKAERQAWLAKKNNQAENQPPMT